MNLYFFLYAFEMAPYKSLSVSVVVAESLRKYRCAFVLRRWLRWKSRRLGLSDLLCCRGLLDSAYDCESETLGYQRYGGISKRVAMLLGMKRAVQICLLMTRRAGTQMTCKTKYNRSYESSSIEGNNE